MKLLTSVLLSTALLYSQSAIAEKIRLVVSNVTTTNASNIKSASPSISGCVVSSEGDAQWCIPYLPTKKTKRSVQGTEKKRDIIVFEVDSQGHSAKEVADYFHRDGRFGLVEVDVSISSHSFRPNDPQHSSQEAYFTSAIHSNSGLNIYGLWDALGQDAVINKNDAIDIIVMDSVFNSNNDLPYFDGRNFSTTALEEGGEPQSRSDDFTPPLENENLHCNPHGLGVASTIGANIDNSSGIAGMTNNANIYAIKVMTCGNGFLADVAAALYWLAGKNYEGVTPYQGQPSIVNMSLGGNSGPCPRYMQNSIDAAIEAGFTLVASAGNDSVDASNNAPSNCKGVLSIGALDRSANLADFSNFGSDIDVVAQGVDILGYCNSDSDNACWWEGTSFSAPQVAGSLAIIKQSTKATNDVLTAALKISSSLHGLGADCQSGECGYGIPDFAKTLEIAHQMQNGTPHSIQFALGDQNECEQAWFIDHFGGKARLCELYKVRFFGGYIAPNTTYELWSIDSAGSWGDESETREGIFEKGTAMLKGIDVSAKKYGFKTCENGLCSKIIEMDTSNVNEDKRPAVCVSP